MKSGVSKSSVPLSRPSVGVGGGGPPARPALAAEPETCTASGAATPAAMAATHTNRRLPMTDIRENGLMNHDREPRRHEGTERTEKTPGLRRLRSHLSAHLHALRENSVSVPPSPSVSPWLTIVLTKWPENMSPSRARAHVTFASVAAPLLAILTAALVWLAVSTGALSSDRKDAADARAGTVAPAPIVAPLGAGRGDGPGPAEETRIAVGVAVMGDVGRGDLRGRIDTAAEMARWRERFDFAFVLMLGDNSTGLGTPEDYAARFERPYKTLPKAGVMFYAANGNHDPPTS